MGCTGLTASPDFKGRGVGVLPRKGLSAGKPRGRWRDRGPEGPKFPRNERGASHRDAALTAVGGSGAGIQRL